MGRAIATEILVEKFFHLHGNVMFRFATSLITLLALFTHAVVGSCHHHSDGAEQAHAGVTCQVVACCEADHLHDPSMEIDTGLSCNCGSSEHCPQCACALRDAYSTTIASRIATQLTIDIGLRQPIAAPSPTSMRSRHGMNSIVSLDRMSCVQLQSWQL